MSGAQQVRRYLTRRLADALTDRIMEELKVTNPQPNEPKPPQPNHPPTEALEGGLTLMWDPIDSGSNPLRMHRVARVVSDRLLVAEVHLEFDGKDEWYVCIDRVRHATFVSRLDVHADVRRFLHKKFGEVAK